MSQVSNRDLNLAICAVIRAAGFNAMAREYWQSEEKRCEIVQMLYGQVRTRLGQGRAEEFMLLARRALVFCEEEVTA